MVEDVIVYKGHRLYLCRDDVGAGGWSLHSSQQMKEAGERCEPPEWLMVGTSTWDNTTEEWTNPTNLELDTAVRMLGGPR